MTRAIVAAVFIVVSVASVVAVELWIDGVRPREWVRGKRGDR